MDDLNGDNKEQQSLNKDNEEKDNADQQQMIEEKQQIIQENEVQQNSDQKEINIEEIDKKQNEVIINTIDKYEILPSVIQILPSVIPQSPPNRLKRNSEQPNNLNKNKPAGIIIQIKEDRSMCKIHVIQPIILICNVCHKLLCIKCLNQHEQHPESTEADQYQSLELFIKNELQNQQTMNKLKQISLDYNCKIKEFQKKVQQNIVNFENTFIENLKKTLIDQIDKKKMELIGYLKQNQYECIEELIKSNEQLTDSMNSINWLFKNFDMVEDINDVYKFNEFYEIIQKVQLSKVYAQYDKIINSVNERVKELSSQMIMQLLKQFFDNLQRLNPDEAGKINQLKNNLPEHQSQLQQPKFKYVAKEAEMMVQQQGSQQQQQQFPSPKPQDVTGKKRSFKSFKTVKDNSGKEAPKTNGNGVIKPQLQQNNVINIDDEEEQANGLPKKLQYQFGQDEETKKRALLIQKYKEKKNELNQANKQDDEINFNFPPPKKNVHLEQQAQTFQNQKLINNENPIIAEINRKRQQLEDELLELRELQVQAEIQPNNNNFSETSNGIGYEQQQQQGQQGEKAKRGGRKPRVNTCGHPDLPHKSLGKCAKCYSTYRKSLKGNSNFNSSMQEQVNPQYYQGNKLFQF